MNGVLGRVSTNVFNFSARQCIMLLAPVALIGSMITAFGRLTDVFGMPLGYFLAFLIYWIGWCLILPVTLLGPAVVRRNFFSWAGLEGGANRVLVLWPLVFPLCFSFVPRLGNVTLPIVGWSVVLGSVIGVTEEIFWRGTFLRLFPDNDWLAIAYPSVLFGLWHLCPLSVVPSHYPGGAVTFVAYSTALGFSYAIYARRSKSLLWVAVSHSVHDALGLGALMYAGWLR